MSQPLYRVVAAILRQGDQILLIQQQGPHDASAAWALPGGLVEDGELLTEALQREVREETGLQVRVVGSLAYTVQVDNRLEGDQLLAFVFEIQTWTGALQPDDPDQHILDAAFFSAPEAKRRLATLPWLPMREPLLAHLDGLAPHGCVWLYRHESTGALRQTGMISGL
jgi:8-oxo-dGTP diphosphatase